MNPEAMNEPNRKLPRKSTPSNLTPKLSTRVSIVRVVGGAVFHVVDDRILSGRIERRLLAFPPSSSRRVPMGTRVYRGRADSPGTQELPEGGVCLAMQRCRHLGPQNGCGPSVLLPFTTPRSTPFSPFRPSRCPPFSPLLDVPQPPLLLFPFHFS